MGRTKVSRNALKTFICCICGKGFGRRQSVKEHFTRCIRKHGNPKNRVWDEDPTCWRGGWTKPSGGTLPGGREAHQAWLSEQSLSARQAILNTAASPEVDQTHQDGQVPSSCIYPSPPCKPPGGNQPDNFAAYELYVPPSEPQPYQYERYEPYQARPNLYGVNIHEGQSELSRRSSEAPLTAAFEELSPSLPHRVFPLSTRSRYYTAQNLNPYNSLYSEYHPPIELTESENMTGAGEGSDRDEQGNRQGETAMRQPRCDPAEELARARAARGEDPESGSEYHPSDEPDDRGRIPFDAYGDPSLTAQPGSLFQRSLHASQALAPMIPPTARSTRARRASSRARRSRGRGGRSRARGQRSNAQNRSSNAQGEGSTGPVERHAFGFHPKPALNQTQSTPGRFASGYGQPPNVQDQPSIFQGQSANFRGRSSGIQSQSSGFPGQLSNVPFHQPPTFQDQFYTFNPAQHLYSIRQPFIFQGQPSSFQRSRFQGQFPNPTSQFRFPHSRPASTQARPLNVQGQHHIGLYQSPSVQGGALRRYVNPSDLLLNRPSTIRGQNSSAHGQSSSASPTGGTPKDAFGWGTQLNESPPWSSGGGILTAAEIDEVNPWRVAEPRYGFDKWEDDLFKYRRGPKRMKVPKTFNPYLSQPRDRYRPRNRYHPDHLEDLDFPSTDPSTWPPLPVHIPLPARVVEEGALDTCQQHVSPLEPYVSAYDLTADSKPADEPGEFEALYDEIMARRKREEGHEPGLLDKTGAPGVAAGEGGNEEKGETGGREEERTSREAGSQYAPPSGRE